MKFSENRSSTPPGPVSHANLIALLGGYKRPNDKISYMLEKGELISIRKGLYLFSEALQNSDSSLFPVANLLYGPSYISLYSALAYYGLIPERVNILESVVFKRPKSISTPIGNFRYFSVGVEVFHVGINYVRLNDKTAFLIATPSKALCDMIWHTPGSKIRNTSDMNVFLQDDIRLDMDRIKELEAKEIEHCIKSNRKSKQLEYLRDIIKHN